MHLKNNTLERLSTILPVGGGTSAGIFVSFVFPSPEQIVSTIILGAIGAIVGYLVKLLLDKIFKKNENKKS